MRAVKLFIRVLALTAGIVAFAGEPAPSILGSLWEPRPFWREKRHEKTLEERKILVSVINQESRTWMKGAGWVKSDLDRAFRFAQDYQRLGQLPNHFSEIRHDPKEKTLALVVHLPFRRERMKFHLDPVEHPKDRFLQFEIIEGWGKGTKGVLHFRELPRPQPLLEISVQSVTPPFEGYSWLLNRGIEAMLKHTASAMRTLLEKEALAEKGSKPR